MEQAGEPERQAILDRAAGHVRGAIALCDALGEGMPACHLQHGLDMIRDAAGAPDQASATVDHAPQPDPWQIDSVHPRSRRRRSGTGAGPGPDKTDSNLVNDSAARLSDGQKACLRLVAKGMSSKEISKETGLTPQTVDTYVKAAISRLGVTNRREAARALVLWEESAGAEPLPIGAPGNEPPSAQAPAVATARERGTGLGLPPVGGRINDLGWAEKSAQALKIALVATAAVVALALVIAGAMRTFS